MKRKPRTILATITLAIMTALPATSGSFAASESTPKQPANAEQDDRCGPGGGMGFRRGMRDRKGMGRGRRRGGQRFMQRFGAIDENGDDRIGADEAASQRESVFITMDADDDGVLTVEEYMAVRMGPGPRREGGNKARQKQRQESKKARFAPMDTDGNGKVSKVEWMLAGQKRYKAADADGDGFVTPWEFRSQHHSN